MKEIMFKRAVKAQGQHFSPWVPYVCFDNIPGMLAKTIDPQDYVLRDCTVPLWDGQSCAGSMLVIGGGGAGDRVQQTPALRKLSQKIGGPVDVATNIGETTEWQGLPYIRSLLPWCPPLELVDQYEGVVTFENILGGEDERTLHLSELFAKRCHVGPLSTAQEQQCDYELSEADYAMTPLPPKESTWVVLQMRSNGAGRNWPTTSVVRLAEMLAKRPDTLVILTGKWDDLQEWSPPVYRWGAMLPAPPEGIVNLCGRFWSMRQMAVLLSKCDLFIGPDSGPLHIAGALGTQAIGIYGPHTYETRGAYFGTVHPVFAKDPTPGTRCPCHFHDDQRQPWLPCGWNVCRLMASVTPESVYDKALTLLGDKSKLRIPSREKIAEMAARAQNTEGFSA